MIAFAIVRIVSKLVVTICAIASILIGGAASLLILAGPVLIVVYVIIKLLNKKRG